MGVLPMPAVVSAQCRTPREVVVWLKDHGFVVKDVVRYCVKHQNNIEALRGLEDVAGAAHCAALLLGVEVMATPKPEQVREAVGRLREKYQLDVVLVESKPYKYHLVQHTPYPPPTRGVRVDALCPPHTRRDFATWLAGFERALELLHGRKA